MASWPEFRPTGLLARLVGANVDFVVVGGIAVVAHGYLRTTKDLDICYATHDRNLEALGRVLIDLGASLRGIEDEVPFAPDGRTLRRTQILTLDSAEGPIDLVVDPSGSPGYAALKKRALRIDLDGLEVLIASIEDLIAMKSTTSRTQDQADIEALEAIQRLQKRRGSSKRG